MPRTNPNFSSNSSVARRPEALVFVARIAGSVRPNTERPDGRRPRVLVLDPDTEFARVLTLVLADEGVDVTTAEPGPPLTASVETAIVDSAAPFDLVVCGMFGPCDGAALDVLRALRRLQPTRSIAFVTALSETDSHEQAQRLGAVPTWRRYDKLRDVFDLLWELLPR